MTFMQVLIDVIIPKACTDPADALAVEQEIRKFKSGEKVIVSDKAMDCIEAAFSYMMLNSESAL